MEELKPLLRILVEAVPRLYDPLSRKQAARLFAAVLGRGGKTCHEGSLAMLMQSSKKVDSATALALLFSWSCDLAAQAALPEGGVLQGPAFPKLVALQCHLLARVAQADKNKLTASCIAKVNALFDKFKDALNKYLDVVNDTKDEVEIEGGVRMVASYFGHKSRANDPAFAPVKEALIKLYNTGVLSATQGSKGRKISLSTSLAFEGLMRWITHEEFALLMSEIDRILRRTPDYLMDSIALTLTHLTIDTSRYVKHFTDILAENILQEQFQQSAIQLVTALARQSSDVSAVLPLGSALNKVLATKTKTWQDRVTISTALNHLLTICKGKGMSPLAEEILGSLAVSTDKEIKEEVKCAGLSLIGVCCWRADKCSAEVFKVLNKCLETGSDVVRRAAMQALHHAMRAGGVRSAAVEMVAGLVKVAQTADKKPAYRPNTLSALRMLLVLMQEDGTAGAKWSEAKLWQLVVGKDSYISSLCESENTTEEELLAMVEVVEALLKDHKGVLLACKQPEEQLAPYTLLALLLTHPTYTVHKAAAGVVIRQQNEATFIEVTIEQLFQLMLKISASPTPPKTEGPSPTHASVCFGRAIIACLPGGVVPYDVLGLLLLLTHSETVMTGHVPYDTNGLPMVWSRIETASSKASGKAMKQVLCEHMESLCGELLSPNGTQSQDERQRLAALRVLGTLARQDLDVVLPKVMNFIGEDLNPEPLLAFGSRDIAIYYTPEGELAKNTEFDR